MKLNLEELKMQLENIENVSDGYHTFNELYYHRMILFSVICNVFKNSAWKSKLHSDGTMYEGYFIVGIDTPEGQYTYHYDMKHWDDFKVKELEKAPEYDGHKPEDITRLLSLTKEITIKVTGIPKPSDDDIQKCIDCMTCHCEDCLEEGSVQYR